MGACFLLDILLGPKCNSDKNVAGDTFFARMIPAPWGASAPPLLGCRTCFSGAYWPLMPLVIFSEADDSSWDLGSWASFGRTCDLCVVDFWRYLAMRSPDLKNATRIASNLRPPRLALASKALCETKSLGVATYMASSNQLKTNTQDMRNDWSSLMSTQNW